MPRSSLLSGRSWWLAMAVALVPLTGCGGSTTQTVTPQIARHASSGLTASGTIQRSFEALLRRQFPRGDVCSVAHARTVVRFVSGDCTPLARYDPYLFTFTRPGTTTLRLTSTAPKPGVLGNYPLPIVIGTHHYVKCGTNKYLVRLGETVSFTLACVSPLYPRADGT